jgi:hypothetical protein
MILKERADEAEHDEEQADPDGGPHPAWRSKTSSDDRFGRLRPRRRRKTWLLEPSGAPQQGPARKTEYAYAREVMESGISDGVDYGKKCPERSASAKALSHCRNAFFTGNRRHTHSPGPAHSR